MATKKTPAPTTAAAAPSGATAPAYALHIELRDLQPKVWREICVPPDITLRRLHAVIQAAMGWENAHMHGFAIPGTGRAGRYWGVPSGRRFEPRNADGMGFAEPANDDATEPLNHVLRHPKDKLLYLYDYGDDWEHLVTLRGSTVPLEPLPYLAAGQGRCPPEDCGGIGGYLDLVAAWHDPAHEEHDGLREWLEDMGHTGPPDELDAGRWAALQKAVARLRPRAPRATRKKSE